MRTLEDWFKYLEQQYVDEKAEKQKEEPRSPAQKEATPPSEVSAPMTSRTATSSVQPQRSPEPPPERKAITPPAQEQVRITETLVPDPAEYIFTLRRATSKPTPEPQASSELAQAVSEPQPAAEAVSPLAEPSEEEATAERAESAAESLASEEPSAETRHTIGRPARAKAARRAPYTRSVRPVPPPQSIEELWKRVPKHVRLLVELGDDEVTQRYYDRRFKESRQELVERLLNPSLTLEDTARLLGVCPTTVRRYTERGLLNHYRTPGNQRRFRLSDVIAFVEARQQAQEARRRKR